MKTDTEGHEFEAISRLIDDGEHSVLPALLMFELNRNFADKTAAILELLGAKDYVKFVWWIKQGADRVLLHETRNDSKIPPPVAGFTEDYYGNVLASRPPLATAVPLSGQPGGGAGELWVEESPRIERIEPHSRVGRAVSSAENWT